MSGVSMARLIDSAVGILRHTVRVQQGEKVFVVHDIPRASVGRAFIAAAEKLGNIVSSFNLGKERFEQGGIEQLEQAVSRDGPYVFVNVFTSSTTTDGKPETPYRIRLLGHQLGSRELCPDVPEGLVEVGQRCRVMHSPGITEEALGWEVDYGQMAARMERIKDAFPGTQRVNVTTQLGTNLTLGVGDRPLHAELTIDQPGKFKNWPPGESYFAPLEDSAEGEVVVDGTIGDFGVPPRPVRMLFHQGGITSIDYSNHQGLSARDKEFLTRLTDSIITKDDPQAAVIGELGIGIADFPQTGEMLTDEKIYGTTHFAVGGNTSFGGKNTAKTHRDHLMWQPTIEFVKRDGSSLFLMRDGELA
jgi:leucyl aminopeptidase (aminopeptidase T)